MQTLTTQTTGDLQVHGRDYQQAPGLDVVVADPAAVEAAVRAAAPAASVERRIVGAGLAGDGDRATGAVVLGVQPVASTKVAASAVDARAHHADAAAGEAPAAFHVVDGSGLSTTARHEVVVGRDLAVQLGVKPGDTLALVGQTAHGVRASDRFNVVGVVDAGTAELDATALFMNVDDAGAFFDLGAAVHILVVRLPTSARASAGVSAEDDDDVNDLAEGLRQTLANGSVDGGALEVLTWSQLMPELTTTMEQKAKSQRAVDKILFFLVGLGVWNAMTMATFERTREFGVLLALGTRPRRIVGLVVVEALLQGVIGLALGAVLALAFVAVFSRIEFAGLSQGDVMGIRIPSVIELRLSWSPFVDVAGTVVVTMLLGGLLPALRAARLRPVDAMRAP